MDRWRKKIAVVTGAGSGIGEAITRALLESGINVVGIDVKEQIAMKNLNPKSDDSECGQFYSVKCDISHGDEIKKTFEIIEKSYGGVDIMVNNAAVISYERIIGEF